jgi:hypothetical protein
MCRERSFTGHIGKRIMFILVLNFIITADAASGVFEDPRGSGTPMMGVPFSAFASREGGGTDICPEGVRVVSDFMNAWAREDYHTMFSLIDNPELREYTLEEAKMDFRFMEYKSYKISSVRQQGDDFEFLLTYGDWRDGDKDMKKIVISGKTFKIILQKNRSVFLGSLAGYF